MASRPPRLARGHRHLPPLPRRKVARFSWDRAGEGVLRPSQATRRYVVGRSERPAVRWASSSCPPLPGQGQRPRPGGTGRAAGVRRSSSAAQGGTATGALCKQDTEARGPAPHAPQRSHPGQQEATLQPWLLGTPPGAGSEGRGLWGRLGGGTAPLGQRPAAERATDDTGGWRSVQWDSEC